MNLRIEIQPLRWGLVLLNLGCLATLCACVWLYFLGEPDELRIDLPDGRDYVLEVDKGSRGTNERAKEVRTRLYRKPLPPKPIAKPPEPKKQDYRDSGPLDAYEIHSIAILAENNVPAVFLGERQAEPAASPRPARSRVRSSRGRTSRPPRSGARKGSRAMTPSANKGRIVGEEFKGCIIEKILVDEYQIVYSQGGVMYRLVKEPRESSVETKGGGYVLSPIPDEDVVAAPALEPDDRGAIRSGDGKETPKKNAARSPSAVKDKKNAEKMKKQLEEAAKKDPKALRKQLEKMQEDQKRGAREDQTP